MSEILNEIVPIIAEKLGDVVKLIEKMRAENN